RSRLELLHVKKTGSPKIASQRTLFGVERTRVSVPVDPSALYQTPPAVEPPAPPIRSSEPSVVVALRTLLPLLPIVKSVDVSMLPATSMRPATRLTAVPAVVTMLA